MLDPKEERIFNLKKFDENKEKYNLKLYDTYKNKIQEFNQELGFDGTKEENAIREGIKKKIADLESKIFKVKQERSYLEEDLKFEEAEEKDATILSLEHELDNYYNRLKIVKNKIEKEKNDRIKRIAAEVKKISDEYHRELEDVINNAREDLNNRQQRLMEDQRNFSDKYRPVVYTISEVEENIKRMEKYI